MIGQQPKTKPEIRSQHVCGSRRLDARLAIVHFVRVGLWAIALTACGSFGLDGFAYAQELNSPEPVQLVNSSQRLTVEQIEALIQGSQLEDALAQLQTLKDQTTALIELTELQHASTLRVQPYMTLELWYQRKLDHILSTDERLRADYQQQWDALAAAAIKQVQSSKDATEAANATRRFRASKHGDVLALMLVDIQLEHGDAVGAIQSLMKHFPALMQVKLRDLEKTAGPAACAWHQLWKRVERDAASSEKVLSAWQTSASRDEKLTVALLRRLLTASAIEPELVDYDAIRNWISVVTVRLTDDSNRLQLEALLSEVKNWSSVSEVRDQPKLAQDFWSKRPAWQNQLERWSNRSDLTPASKPAVGQLQATLPYYPVLHENKIFVNELTRIRAYQVENGATWPKGIDVSLFDSQTNPAAWMPLGYPLQGSPRGGLAIHENCLYARMGSPVTGWVNRAKTNDGSSFSYLVGLDLDKQGSLLMGFPLELHPPLFQDAEFEGTPVVDGRRLIVAVCERDNVGIRRSLAAFDRFSGQLLWRTQTLGSGVVVGSDRANLISAAQPMVCGSLVFFGTDLGSIACVDSSNGQTIWLARYQRVDRLQNGYPRANRFRYRDGNACLIHKDLLYCLPQDCPELFALDAFTGQLVWASNESETSDCTYFVGIYDRSLVVAGDRLVWLNRENGSSLTQFPSLTTPGLSNALPQPRGMGRAMLLGDRVLWPTAETSIFFAADQTSAKRSSRSVESENAGPIGSQPDRPLVLQTLPNRHFGTEGGNWLFNSQAIVIATPGRIICYHNDLSSGGRN